MREKKNQFKFTRGRVYEKLKTSISCFKGFLEKYGAFYLQVRFNCSTLKHFRNYKMADNREFWTQNLPQLPYSSAPGCVVGFHIKMNPATCVSKVFSVFFSSFLLFMHNFDSTHVILGTLIYKNIFQFSFVYLLIQNILDRFHGISFLFTGCHIISQTFFRHFLLPSIDFNYTVGWSNQSWQACFFVYLQDLFLVVLVFIPQKLDFPIVV